MPAIKKYIINNPFKLRAQSPLNALKISAGGVESDIMYTPPVISTDPESEGIISDEQPIDTTTGNDVFGNMGGGDVTIDPTPNDKNKDKDQDRDTDDVGYNDSIWDNEGSVPKGPNADLESRIADPNTNPKRRAKMEVRLKNRKERQADRLVNQKAKAKKIYEKHGMVDWDTRQKEKAESVKEVQGWSKDVEKIADEGINVKPYSYGDFLYNKFYGNENESPNNFNSPFKFIGAGLNINPTPQAIQQAQQLRNPFSPTDQGVMGGVFNPTGNDINQFQSNQGFNKGRFDIGYGAPQPLPNPNTLNEPPIPSQTALTTTDLATGNAPMGDDFSGLDLATGAPEQGMGSTQTGGVTANLTRDERRDQRRQRRQDNRLYRRTGQRSGAMGGAMLPPQGN